MRRPPAKTPPRAAKLVAVNRDWDATLEAANWFAVNRDWDATLEAANWFAVVFPSLGPRLGPRPPRRRRHSVNLKKIIDSDGRGRLEFYRIVFRRAKALARLFPRRRRQGKTMFGWVARSACGAALFGVAFGGFVEASEPKLPSASYAAIGGETSIPYGWVDFCGRRPEECNLGKLTPLDVRLTKKTWAILNQVNRFANDAIEPISNLEHWGTALDHWD